MRLLEKNMSSSINRRQFLRNASGTALGLAGIAFAAASSHNNYTPSVTGGSDSGMNAELWLLGTGKDALHPELHALVHGHLTNR